MDALLKKLLRWLPSNFGSVLGIIQAVLKFVKELATLFLNIIAPLIPGTGDDIAVQKIRDFCNWIDGWIEKLKNGLLSVGR